MIPKFPFFTGQQLNLDWVMQMPKKILAFMPIDKGAVGDVLQRKASGAAWEPLAAATLDINGLQTAEAVADDDELPIYDKTATGNRKATVAAIRAGVTSPVASVNGKTGAVVLDADDVGALPDSYTPPVTSVNGKTGAVVLDADDVGALPDSYTPPVTSVNGKTGAVELDADDVGALPDSYTPPVTSVNGKTGALSVGVALGAPTVVSFPFTPDVSGFLIFYLNPSSSSGGYIIVNDGTSYVYTCYGGTGTTGVLPVAGGREVQQTNITGVTATVRFMPLTMT